MNSRLIYWQRVMQNEREGSERYDFARRMVFFYKMRDLQQRELEYSPRNEDTPNQVTDRWYEEKKVWNWFKNNINLRILLP